MLLIKGGTIIDKNSKHHGKKVDMLIRKGQIEAIKSKITDNKTKTLDASGAYVSLGWIDVGTKIGDPGFEHREDIDSISKVAAAGGFTGIIPLPNTAPEIHSKSEVLYLKNNAKGSLVDIFPAGAISQHCAGKDITEMIDMHHAGAVTFTDGSHSVQDSGLMLRALMYVKAFNGIVMNMPFDESTSNGGQIHEGRMSTSMGMKGIPSLSEELMVHRDIYLSEYADSKLHLFNLSSGGTMQAIKEAKAKKIKVSASVPLLNLIYDTTVLEDFDPNYKVLPPLREKKDITALRKALKEDVIDLITSNHTPLESELKNLEFPNADFGIINLQTFYPLLNTHLGKTLSNIKLAEKLAVNPRKLFNLPTTKIEKNESANLTIFHPKATWTFTEKENLSKSKNSPFFGTEFKGKILATVNNGKLHLNN